MSRRAWLVVLLSILGFGALIRFWQINLRGLIYWDEGKFALEGMRLYGLIFHHSVPGKTIGTAKPTHALLIALSSAVLGPNDLAPLILNAFCSVVCVGVVAFVSLHLFDRSTAIVVALLLAASEYETVYARSALSESDGALIFFLALLVYVRRTDSEHWTHVAVASVLGGLSFTVNYRLSVYLVALVAYDGIRTLKRRGWSKALRRTLVWGTGLLIFPLLWEAVDLLARLHGLVLFRSELSGRPALYLQEAWYQIHEGRQSHLRWNPLPYIYWYVVRIGPTSLILTVAAVAVSVVGPRSQWRFLATLVVVPLGLFSLAPFTVPRSTQVAAAVSCMLVGRVLIVLARRGPSRLIGTGAVATLIVLIATLGVVRTEHLIQERSGFKVTAEYLHDHHAGRAFATSELLVYYLADARGCNVLPIPTDIAHLRLDMKNGYRFLVLDHTPHSSGTTLAAIVKSAPVATRVSILGVRPVHEDPISFEDGSTEEPLPGGKFLTVYRLESLSTSNDVGYRRVGCDFDTVL